MRRPMPATPRGPRRRTTSETVALLLPRLDPAWELAALTALMKPPRRSVWVRHAAPEQGWTPQAAGRVQDLAAIVAGRLGVSVAAEYPAEGDYLAVIRLTPASNDLYRAMAAVLSRATPGLGWKLSAAGALGSLVVRDGRFYRRTRRVQLALTLARDIGLPRELRAGLVDLLPPRRSDRGVG